MHFITPNPALCYWRTPPQFEIHSGRVDLLLCVHACAPQKIAHPARKNLSRVPSASPQCKTSRTRGLHRGFVPLRFTGPRGSTKALAGGVACMAGSLTSGSGLVFLGKAVGSALQVTPNVLQFSRHFVSQNNQRASTLLLEHLVEGIHSYSHTVVLHNPFR